MVRRFWECLETLVRIKHVEVLRKNVLKPWYGSAWSDGFKKECLETSEGFKNVLKSW
jgi:hypothetical protein